GDRPIIRQRALTTIATASLLARPLAACTSSNGEEGPTTTTTSPEARPTADPADATPQQRITAYFEASDAAAADGRDGARGPESACMSSSDVEVLVDLDRKSTRLNSSHV